MGNLVNQHVRFIESGEFLTYPKPTGGNSLDRLIERKQMSTKTTFKRIALVTVAALGFGVLTSAAPASAAIPTTKNFINGVSFGDTTQNARRGDTDATVARAGYAVAVDIKLSSGSGYTIGSAENFNVNTYVKFNTVPAGDTALASMTGSALSPSLSAHTLVTGSLFEFGSGVLSNTAVAASNATPGYLAIVAGSTLDTATNLLGSKGATKVGTFTFTPAVAGTYKVDAWVDDSTAGNAAASRDAGERAATKTITVGGAPTSIVVTSLGTAAVVGDIAPTSAGHVYQVSIKDAAGNVTAPVPGEAVGVTLTSGTGTISDASLTMGDFDSNGYAYVTITGTATQTGTFTFAASGFTATSVVTSSTGTLANAAPSTFTLTQTTGVTAGSGFVSTINVAQTVNATARAVTFATGKAVTMRITSGSSAAATSRVVGVKITDTDGILSGNDNAPSYYAAVAIDDTLGYGSITLPTTTLAAGESISVVLETTAGADSAAVTFTAATVALSSNSTLSPATASIVTGGGVELTAQCLDQHGQAVSGCAVSWTVAGRNVTTVPTQKLADTNGYSTYTLTDASTSTTSLTDTVSAAMTYGSSTNTETATITWGAGNAVDSITVTSSPTLTVATVESSISTAATGPEAGAVTLTFTVKDAAGVPLVGTPVTFAADSANVSFKSSSTDTANRKLAYTSSTGVATTYIAGWVAPSTVTVTATAGTKTVTTKINYVTVAADARTIALTTTGNIAVATVKDRFGNPVKGASVTWSRTGAGYFGSGVSTATGTTDVNGVTEILVVGEATVSAELAVATYAQVDDASGYVGTTATSGTGATLAPAGVAKATLAIAAAASDATAQAAVDAAAEATDAANAATDAANASAEAADAATAAAQDAADAVAALSTQVSEMVNALKKQITALTNLVIKIQKKVKA